MKIRYISIRKFLVAIIIIGLTIFILQGCRSFSETNNSPCNCPPSTDSSFVPYDEPPNIVHYCKPVYPKEAIVNGIEETVWLKVLVDTIGKVCKAEVISGDSIFYNSVIGAAFCCTFTPAMQNGKPVCIWTVLYFEFKLSSGKQ